MAMSVASLAFICVTASASSSSTRPKEFSPQFDRDGQSARWAALAVWNFLVGLALRTNGGARS
jgi:hypothetical protein